MVKMIFSQKQLGKIYYKQRAVIMFLPSLIGFTVFYILPFFRSMGYAFVDNTFTQNFVGLQNFLTIWGNEYFRLAMKNTLLFTCIAVPLVLLLGLLFSAGLIRITARIANILQNSAFLPVLLPSASMVMFWQAYLSSIKPFSSLLLFYLWKYLGLHVMLFLCAMTAIPKKVLEAAEIDGAGGWRRLWKIELPCIRSTVFFSAVLAIVNSLKIFRESYLLYGAYPDESVYMIQNYLNNHFEKMNLQNVSTVAIYFALAVYIITLILFRWDRKVDVS